MEEREGEEIRWRIDREGGDREREGEGRERRRGEREKERRGRRGEREKNEFIMQV